MRFLGHFERLVPVAEGATFEGIKMRVLVACEFSGIVRDAFAAHGHDAWSCDLLPTEKPGNHYQGDILDCLCAQTEPFDLMIAHPPCTYLAVSGARWFKERQKEQERALDFRDIRLRVPKMLT